MSIRSAPDIGFLRGNFYFAWTLDTRGGEPWGPGAGHVGAVDAPAGCGVGGRVRFVVVFIELRQITGSSCGRPKRTTPRT